MLRQIASVNRVARGAGAAFVAIYMNKVQVLVAISKSGQIRRCLVHDHGLFMAREAQRVVGHIKSGIERLRKYRRK